MKPDPNDPRGTRLVKCIIQGNDAWPGEEITVNAGKGNDNYKCVVPASAVNQDNSNDFVYVIEGSSTPLGDKYTVKRVDVTIEATDGMVTVMCVVMIIIVGGLFFAESKFDKDVEE